MFQAKDYRHSHTPRARFSPRSENLSTSGSSGAAQQAQQGAAKCVERPQQRSERAAKRSKFPPVGGVLTPRIFQAV